VQPLWETAVGSEAAGSEAQSISGSTLAPIVEAAKLLWANYLGAGDARLAVLNGVNVQVGNLPDDRLGVTLGQLVYIDSDAAGRGWQAMDLLSVVTHELGHVLGFDHDDAGAIPVMTGTLDADAHYQLGIAGNSAASSGLAGVSAGADIARQVIGQQSSDASIVSSPAKSALTNGLGFSTSRIVVRAASLLDYTVGAADVTGKLIKAVNLTPYRLDPTPDAAGDNMTYRPSNSDDIIYGDLGRDFLRGRAGDHLVSGAEALVESYIGYFERNDPDTVGVERSDDARPFSLGNALAYGGRYAGLGAYSNLDAGESLAAGTNGADASVYSDGNARLFGDFGNDWIVGGTGKDSAIDSGQFTVSGGAHQVSPTKPSGDAAAAFNIDEWLTYFELKASIVASKPTGATSPTPT
jgi:hypothetical protein